MTALKGDKTQGELATEFEIHPLQISAWKKQAIEAMTEIFGKGPERSAAESAQLESRLYEKIGRLETELEWLKKSLEPSGRTTTEHDREAEKVIDQKAVSTAGIGSQWALL